MELFHFQINGDTILSQRGQHAKPSFQGRDDLLLLEKQGCWIVLGAVTDNPTKIPLCWAAPGLGLGQVFFQTAGASGGWQRLY